MTKNLDPGTVDGFGREWARFDQERLSDAERKEHFDKYFAVFPWGDLPDDAEGFDMGCGSGRWAALVAPRVGHLHCIDASADAIGVAKRALSDRENCSFHVASVDKLPLADSSMDFGYSLGVLHHVPDTMEGLRSCVTKLKTGAPMLVYLYYALDGRPTWFRRLFSIANRFRGVICTLPQPIKQPVTDIIALAAYWPLARAARLAELAGFKVDGMPLSTYRTRSFYSMRTDALDRFGTSLEQRFTQDEVVSLLEEAGCVDVVVSQTVPYWCAVGIRADPGHDAPGIRLTASQHPAQKDKSESLLRSMSDGGGSHGAQ